MVREPDTQGPLLGVENLPGNLTARQQDEGIWTRGMGFQEAELLVVDSGITGRFRQASADEGEKMTLIALPDVPHTLECLIRAQRRAERVAGVRRIGDHTPGTQQGPGLADGSRLGVFGMNGQQDSHDGSITPNPCPWLTV